MHPHRRPARVALSLMIAALVVMVAPARVAAQAPWAASLEEAHARRTSQRLPIVYYLYTSDTGPRELALAPLWNDPEVAGRLGRLAAARVSVRSPDGTRLAQEHRIIRVPTLLVLGADGAMIGRLERDDIQRASLLSLLDQALRQLGPAATPAPTPTPVAGWATPTSTPAASFGLPVAPDGERQMIVGWCQLERVEPDGAGRGTYEGRPILVRGMPPTQPGQWIYFSDLGDRGTHLEARYAPPPVIHKDPPVNPATGRPHFEVGMWFECEIVEPSLRDPSTGVARLRGKVTFVPQTVAGDRVIIELVEVADRFNTSRVMYRFPKPTPAPTPAGF